MMPPFLRERSESRSTAVLALGASFSALEVVLFCLRGMRPDLYWNEKVLKISFWCFNLGLALMALLTLLPLGTLQLLAAINHGYWYARSAEFMQQPIVELLIWMRVPGDTIFSIGALALVYFVISLWLWPKQETEQGEAPGRGRPPVKPNPEPAG